MISLWFLGDAGRLGYYLAIGAPNQFIIGGILTVCMDGVVLVQFLLWRHKLAHDDDENVNMTYETEGMKMETMPIQTRTSN